MKTAKEAIKALSDGTDTKSEIGKIINQYGDVEIRRYRIQILTSKLLEDGFKNGVEFAQRWIPVEEELPEKLVQVIVKLENDWCTCTWITEDGDFAFNVKPTHWRHIDIE